MSKTYDLIVIGTGTAGTTVAQACRAKGWDVAIVDSREYGGTCALRGCDPKKIYTAVGESLDWLHRLQEHHGVHIGDAEVNWNRLQEFKHSFTDPFPEYRRKSYQEAGIVTYDGRAQFTGESTLRVGESELAGEHILIATGASPRQLNVPGEEYVMTSEGFLNLEELPSRIAFIGAGYISMEFANVAAQAGAEVTVIHRAARPLKQFDPDLVGLLVQAARQRGIQFQFNTEVTAVEKRTDAHRVIGESNEGEVHVSADLVVHGAGRVPQLSDLNLAEGNVAAAPGGVRVNAYLQSVTNPRVYAAGDAAFSGPPLTPVATLHGKAVSQNLLEGNRVAPDYTPIPSVVYSLPPLARVGLTEEEARKQDLQFQVKYAETGRWFTSRRINESYSGYKILVEDTTEQILGAHLLGPHAEEVINIFALAMKARAPASMLREMVFSYPTSSSDINYMV